MPCIFLNEERGMRKEELRWRRLAWKFLSRNEIRLRRMKLLRNEILPAAIWNICYANVNGGNTRTPRPNKFRKRKRFASKPFMGLKINRLLSLAYFFGYFIRFFFVGNNTITQARSHCIIKAHFWFFKIDWRKANLLFQNSKLHFANAVRVQSSLYFADLFADKAKSGEIPPCISSIFNTVCRQISK